MDAYDTETAALPAIPLGARVRLRGKPICVTLRSRLGRVIEPDRSGCYDVIRLDEPAIYDNGVGETRDLHDIVEPADNLDVLAE